MYRIVLAICIIIVVAPYSFAQDGSVPITFYANSGLSIPAAPSLFYNYWKMGFNGGGGIGYAITPNLTIRGYVDYNNFAFDAEGFLEHEGYTDLGVTVVGGSISILVVSANLKAAFIPGDVAVSPYFTGGGGYFNISASDVTATNAFGQTLTASFESESAFSAFFGIGFDIPINEQLAAFVEGKYAIGLTEGENTQYFPINVGVSYSLK